MHEQNLPMRQRPLEIPHICDQCGRPRVAGNHEACSRKRQAEYRAARGKE